MATTATGNNNNCTIINMSDKQQQQQQQQQAAKQIKWENRASAFLARDILEAETSPPAPPILDYSKKRTRSKACATNITHLVPPRGIGPVYSPNQHDVLCGRGGGFSMHSGNILLRKMVEARKSDYLSLPKCDKKDFALKIVKTIRRQEPEGRFLDQYPEGNDPKAWYDIGDACAIHKVQRVFCNAPEIIQSVDPPRQRQPAYESVSDTKACPTNITHLVPPRGIGPVYKPNQHDVLCGRGTGFMMHEGNILLRKLVEARKSDYFSLPKCKKRDFAFEIVKTIRRQEPEGRFLDQYPEGNDPKAWYDIGDACAIRKVQAVFCNAPKLRHEIIHPVEPQDVVPPRAIGPVYKPNQHDVLCGRGGGVNMHEGNILLRKMVEARKSDYLSLPKLKKRDFAFEIVKTIRRQEPEGRFLDQDPEDDQKAWYDIGDAWATTKVQQVFRNAPKLCNQHTIEPPPRQQQPANESGSVVIVDDGNNPRKKCCYYDDTGYGHGSVLTHHSFGGNSFPSSNHEHGFALWHPYYDCEPNRHAAEAGHPIHYSNDIHHYPAVRSWEIQQPGQTWPRYQMAVPPHWQQQQQMMNKSSQESSMSQLLSHPGAPPQMQHERYDQQQQMRKQSSQSQLLPHPGAPPQTHQARAWLLDTKSSRPYGEASKSY